MSKAAGTFREAACLRQHQHWDGAANRAYYSLFQAVSAALRANGWPPEKLRQGEDSYRHGMVSGNIELIGLTLDIQRKMKRVYRAAKGLRTKADYYDDSVAETELTRMMEWVRSCLQNLGLKL